MPKTKSLSTAPAQSITLAETASRSFSLSRTTWIFYALLLIVFAVAYTHIFDEKINLNGDNIYYHILGTSLAEGHGYRDTHNPLMPLHNHYPPGYPFLISLFIRLGFTDISFFSALNGFFAAGSLVLLFATFIRYGIHKQLAFVTCLLAALNPTVLNYAAMNMSEVPFLFFSVLTLFLFSFSGKKPFFKDIFFWAALLTAIATFYLRTTGIALIGALFIGLLLKRKWLAALCFIAGFTLAVLPWQMRTASLGGNAYMSQLMMKNCYRPELGKATTHDFLHRIFENVKRYTALELPNGFLPAQFEEQAKTADATTGYWIMGYILIAFLLWGLFRMWKLNKTIVLYLVFTAGIVLLWPEFWLGPRFIMPVLPLMIAAMLVGLDSILRYTCSKLKIGWQPLLLTPLILLSVPAVKLLGAQLSEPYPATYQSYFDAAAWAGANLPADAVFSARKPELFYIFSGRKCTGYLYTNDDKELLNNLRQQGVQYIVIDALGFASTTRYLVPALKAHATEFDVVYHTANPDVYIIKFNNGKPSNQPPASPSGQPAASTGNTSLPAAKS